MSGPADGDGAGAPLRVRLLGGFAVEGLDERELGTRKARLLLKRLAVALGRPVATDELAAAVWGHAMPQKPADQLSVLVSRLRGVLGADRLPRSDGGYALAADWIDLVELDRRSGEVERRLADGELGAAVAAAHAAMALATGRLLPEEDGPWLDEVRPATDRLVARARLLAAEASLAVGEVAAARAAAQGALDHDPYDERALRLVMRADAFAGRPGAALAAYAKVRHRLSEDLGTDPTAETEALHTAIVRGELPTVSAAPAPPPEVVGREEEGRLLDGLLVRASEGTPVAAVIEAEAGLGKSTLLAAWTARASGPALVLTGRCDELAGGLPLEPLIDGLAGHLDALGHEAAAELLGADARVLDPLLARADPAGIAVPTTVADLDTGRSLLFGALATVLRRAAGERVLVLAVDDLHQAAPGTAEFLHFAARRLPRLMVLATRRPESGPDLPDALRIALGPLGLAEAVALVGPELGPTLHQRSGGHPLFLRALAGADTDELPDSILTAVRARVVGLGSAAQSIETAALCGTEVDVELVAAAGGRTIAGVLDDLERATQAGLLRPRDRALAFSHELVRDAIEANTSPARQVAVHRAAVAHLARRTDTDPLALARHAQLGGDGRIAAGALVAAANRAAERYEPATAEQLLDRSIQLADSAAAHLARARIRMARLDLDGARADTDRAIELGAGVQGFELAGWVAYYRRDYDTALRYAEEGAARTDDAGLRASCLALSGRIRHTRGDLSGAGEHLLEGERIAPPGIRGMLQVWRAQLLVHQGEPALAMDEARRGLLDPHLPHPFAASHGRFTLAYALGLSGQWTAALAVVDDLDLIVARTGDQRFPPVAANIRGWLLRGAGLIGQAEDLHRAAADSAPGPTFREAHYAALLDLAECHLASGDEGAAAAALDAGADIAEWTGSMSWRHRSRRQLLADRLASLGGDHRSAAEDLRAVARAAAERGDPRYDCRAQLLALTIDARAGSVPDLAMVDRLLARFAPISGPEGWRDLAELASALGRDDVWQQAEAHAAAIVAAAADRPELDRDAIATAVRSQLDRLRP